ncbi:MAG: hypothetical protein AAFQ52_17300 [Chloroflexota bacterium]
MWAIKQQQRDSIDKSMEALWLFMLLTNRMKRYGAWLDTALDRLAFADDEDGLRVKLEIYKADSLVEQGLTKQSFEILKAAEADIEDSVDTQTKALALITLSRASYILVILKHRLIMHIYV